MQISFFIHLSKQIYYSCLRWCLQVIVANLTNIIMSWDEYVDRLILTRAVVGAAIIGSDGAMLGASAGMELLEGEGERLLEGFGDPECI